ncbi:MotE family protein [Roseinatronobacter sp.]|uniref:MotE family protein n=1 Tax=Roseinatronobacter sp. TaxID=1945755 RepID=UPI003F6EBD82
MPRTENAASFFVATASAETENEPDGADARHPELAMLEGDMPEDLFAAIKAERELLDAQRVALAERSAEIDLAHAMLATETARLADLKLEVEALLERASLEHVADVERLVALYSNMKPRDAAAIMNDLDLEVMVTVLGTMPERNAAPILAAINPVRARALSLILLERAKFPGDRRLNEIRLD